MPERTDQEMEQALGDWGTSMQFPSTPNLAPRVAAQLRAKRPARTRADFWNWFTTRGVLIGSLVGFILILAVIALIGHKPSHEAAGRTLTARTILKHAGGTEPASNLIIRQTFAVKRTVHGRWVRRRVNVWEGRNNGSFTVIAVTKQPSLAAVRYVEGPNGVNRSWVDPKHSRVRLLAGVPKSPVSIENARLIAAKLMGSTTSWKARYLGRRMVHNHRCYVIGLRDRSTRRAVTIALQTHSYRLVRLRTEGYQATLITSRIFHRSDVPYPVSHWFQVEKTPPAVAAY